MAIVIRSDIRNRIHFHDHTGDAYRERLKGNWGIVDVSDCTNGALQLVAQGLADGNRLAITGGSAGGYTTLAALTFRNEIGRASCRERV